MFSLYRSVLILLGLGVLASGVYGQTTYTATSCSQAAVSTAINNEIASSVDGDIIVVPTCATYNTNSNVWNATPTINVTFTHSVTFTGQGAISAVGHSCASTPTVANCTTGTDQTILYQETGSAVPMLQFGCASGKTCRITGISFQADGNSAAQSNGFFSIGGVYGATWRVDHLHIALNAGNGGFTVGGAVVGVADHNYFSPGTNGTSHGLTNSIRFYNGQGWAGASAGDVGNQSFASAPNFGGSQFFFAEDNYLYNEIEGDAAYGARYVWRYNILNCDYTTTQLFNQCQMISHATRDGGRGDYAREVYGNTFVQPSTYSPNNTVVPMNSGIAMIWGNSITNFGNIVTVTSSRQVKGSDIQITPQPSGVGTCAPAPQATGTVTIAANSTTVARVSGGTFNTQWASIGNPVNQMLITGALCNSSGKNNLNCPIGTVNSSTSITLLVPSGAAVTGATYEVGSTWDGNTNVYGYPCLDQPGRSQGQLISGNYPNLVNSVTGIQSWPKQVLTPVYIWGNSFTPSPRRQGTTVVASPTGAYTNNTDYYMDFGTYSNSGTFNGTVGIGCGAVSTAGSATATCPNPVARPSTCAYGVDSANGGTATTGVAYWETNNNQLDYCVSPGVWTTTTSSPTKSYVPYTSPHPLTGSGTVTISPASIAFGTVPRTTSSGAQTVTVTNSTTSTITLSGDSLTGTKASDFSLSSDGCNSGTVTAGNACTVKITFTPTASVGTNETATYNFPFTGAAGSPLTISLTGTSGAGGNVTLAPSSTESPLTHSESPRPQYPTSRPSAGRPRN